jgi:hypothetical protein
MAATKGVVTISGLAATTTTAGDVLIFVLGPSGTDQAVGVLHAR